MVFHKVLKLTLCVSQQLSSQDSVEPRCDFSNKDVEIPVPAHQLLWCEENRSSQVTISNHDVQILTQ